VNKRVHNNLTTYIVAVLNLRVKTFITSFPSESWPEATACHASTDWSQWYPSVNKHTQFSSVQFSDFYSGLSKQNYHEDH